ncbi:protein CREG1 [Pundamilia nyererei]|uniref:Protein CREG1 n=1 Tax=Pundamilia nyererei TaxID=303518 RepID=A0AC58NHD8_9CICH
MRSLWRAVRVFLLGLSLASLSLSGASRFHIPPHDQVARVARFVAHQVDWASMATISTHKPVVGQPFSNVFSVSDGPRGSGSGVPYMYLTRMEISVQDLEVSLTQDISVKTGTEPSCSEVSWSSFLVFQVWVLDYFGGVKTVTPDEYFQATPYRKHH